MRLGNDTVEIVTLTDGPVDRLGVPKRIPSYTPVPGGSFQPRGTTEQNTNVDFTSGEWVWIAPACAATAALTGTDELRYKGIRYDVNGIPEPWTDRRGVLHHYTIPCRRYSG